MIRGFEWRVLLRIRRSLALKARVGPSGAGKNQKKRSARRKLLLVKVIDGKKTDSSRFVPFGGKESNVSLTTPNHFFVFCCFFFEAKRFLPLFFFFLPFLSLSFLFPGSGSSLAFFHQRRFA